MKVRSRTLILLSMAVAVLFVTASISARVYTGVQPEPFIIKGLVTIQLEDDVDLGSYQKSVGQASFGLSSLDKILDNNQVNSASPVFPGESRPAINSGLYDLTRYYELSFPEDLPVETIIEQLQQDPNIRMAEPVWAIPVLVAPNDPDFGSQWHLQDGTKRAKFPLAWEIESGSDSIKLALIDTGVNYKHPDLIDNVWVNPGEDLDGDGVVYDEDDLNGIDDDGNGVVDDLIGYDFFSGLGGTTLWAGEDGSSPDPDPNDFNGHGTNCAGIAAATMNNGTGVASAAGGWYGGHRSFGGVKIICLRNGGSYVHPTGGYETGYVNSNNSGTAINYAANVGANVISCSWGSSNTSTMIAGMSNAAAKGVTVCHAAGNDDLDSPDYLDFNPFTNVLSVAATNSNDQKVGFSNYGTWIDVSAPGLSINSTYSNHYTATYASLSGTSMSCPLTAGVALLVRSAAPFLTKEQVDSIVINTTDDIYALNPGYPGVLGSGRINAYAALLDLPIAKFSADFTDGNLPMTIQFTDASPASPNPPSAWDWTFGDGQVSSIQNPLVTYTAPGLYQVSLKADVGNALGWGEEHLRNYVWVRADSMIIDSVDVKAGEKAVIPVYLANTTPIKEIQFAFVFTNSYGVSIDSFSVAGLRTEYFDEVKYTVQNSGAQKYVIRMRSSNLVAGESNYLPPGNGPVLNLYFNVPSSAPATVIPIDSLTINGKAPNCASIWGNYWPVLTVGALNVTRCAHGDANCDGNVNIEDLTALVDYLFRSGPVVDPIGGNVDGLGFVNISDITYLVDYLFKGGPPPPPAI